MNKVILSGRIANEIELMKTKSGKSVMRFGGIKRQGKSYFSNYYFVG